MNRVKGLLRGAVPSNDHSSQRTQNEGLSRRDFLKSAGGSSALAAAMSTGLAGAFLANSNAEADEVGPLSPPSTSGYVISISKDRSLGLFGGKRPIEAQ